MSNWFPLAVVKSDRTKAEILLAAPFCLKPIFKGTFLVKRDSYSTFNIPWLMADNSVTNVIYVHGAF